MSADRTPSAAQGRGVPLMEGLRNLEQGYDRKFALSYCADEVWAALEALECRCGVCRAPKPEALSYCSDPDCPYMAESVPNLRTALDTALRKIESQAISEHDTQWAALVREAMAL